MTQPSVRDQLPRPCIVSIREGEHDPGWLGRRFGRSLKVAADVWRGQISVRRSMLRWSSLGVALLAASVAVLGGSTSLGRAILGATISLVWAAVWLLFIGIHLSGLRDSAGTQKDRLGLPNGLTLLRILLVPAICWAILAHVRLVPHGVAASAIIFVVGFSDVLDGIIARLTGFETILGRNLDHLADVLICSGIALAELVAGLMPGWLAALVLLRYLGAGAGGILSVMFLPNVRIRPSIVGKICTFTVGMTLFLTIAQPLVAPTRKGDMRYLFLLAAALILVNIAAMVLMALRGAAVEHIRPPKGAKQP